MVQTTTVVMNKPPARSKGKVKTKPHRPKGVLYNELRQNGYDSSDNEETTLYEHVPEIHIESGHASGKSGKKAQSKGNKHKKYQSDVTEHRIAETRIEMSELRSRRSGTNLSKTCDEEYDDKPTYIERDISKDDTLQSLALKYSCQVAELKRLNNLIQDQEFYALQKIKVPARKHGILQELVENEKDEITNKSIDNGPKAVINGLEANEDEGDSECEYPDLLVRTVSIRDAVCNQSRDAQDFLHKMDKDINTIVQSTRTRLSSLDEVTDYLTAKRIRPLKKQEGWLSGADCGIRWWSITLWFLLFLLLIPICYIVYYYYHKYVQENSVSTTTVYRSTTPSSSR